MQTGTQAIDRAAQLLVLVVESDESSSVGELAEAAGLPKSTVSRVVSALERQGLVQRQGSRGGIRPGPVLLGLARRGVSGDDIVALCRDTLERLGEASGETIDLAVPVPGGSELYLDQVDSRHFLGTVNWVGRRLPHHCTSVGKVFMAFGAASRRRASSGSPRRRSPPPTGLPKSSAAFARAATRSPSASWSRDWSPSPRRCSDRMGRRSPRSASPGRSCGSTAIAWSSWATCSSPRSPHSPSDLATIP